MSSAAASAQPRRGAGEGRATLTLEHGDTYEGAVEVRQGVALPHGRGVWRCGDGETRYEGAFVQRWRDGYGRLCTTDFTLWARWRMDRPDVASSARVDYPDGSRYSGFVEVVARPRRPPPLTRSKFGAWAASIGVSRRRWGELVYAGGDRYVGGWAEDTREGFGCYVWASGSRYTGRFHRGHFHNTGTLFVAPGEVEGCLSRLCRSGGWRCGGDEGGVVKDGGSDAGAAAPWGVARWPPGSRPGWDGVVVDVVWRDGVCHGEGHVTLPSGVRLSADWRSASSPVDGELVLPTLTAQARTDVEVYEWRESFQWESLFSGADDAAAANRPHRAAHEKVESTRAAIQRSNSAEFVRSCVMDLLQTHDVTKTALHVVQRCFHCLYGTCGVDAEVGAGGHGNALGWCTLRNAYGGCIHHANGRRIGASDLDLALRDVVSLARSMVRWVLDAVGAELQSKVLDCGGEAVIGRWVADGVFQHCYPILLNLYSQVYRAEETALAASLARLRGTITLDDIGAVFARQSESQEKLFDAYTDAVHCVEQLNGEPQTLTGLLKVLVQWSREIDLSTRLTQACRDGRPSTARSTAGSADDLLPIHQYVLSQARCSRLYAVTRLLADFAAEPLFMEATSQEAFGVATAQVCVWTLLRLHPWERDATRVLVPVAVTLDGVREAVQRRPSLAAWVHAACGAELAAPALAEVAQAMQLYAALWVPRVVGWMGEHAVAGPQPVSALGWTAAEYAAVCCDPPTTDAEMALCFSCWLYASSILAAMHLRLLQGPYVVPHEVGCAEEVADACARLRCWVSASGAAACSQWRVDVAASPYPPVPSHLVRLESLVTDLLLEA
ncbi:MORN repeat/Vacuolar sorting protein 9 (VPS9) domain containing protein [Novymonas esmeraldas]|uniref:MORN repeat/Vacuolar sorting protein 9 (VPS9) domain containing protein n=1 Tax=Novymonas esmeraldas TaxID=1808958 RepID=A0AAW0F0H7_9TRYP